MTSRKPHLDKYSYLQDQYTFWFIQNDVSTSSAKSNSFCNNTLPLNGWCLAGFCLWFWEHVIRCLVYVFLALLLHLLHRIKLVSNTWKYAWKTTDLSANFSTNVIIYSSMCMAFSFLFLYALTSPVFAVSSACVSKPLAFSALPL